MNKQTRISTRRLAVAAAVSALLGLGAIAPAIQATEGIGQPDSEAPLILAQTQGMERRQDRRDNRQDCRQEEGLVGKDKRDCKQEGRQEEGEEKEVEDKEGEDKEAGEKES